MKIISLQKILTLLLIGGSLLVTTSCDEDRLDQEPDYAMPLSSVDSETDLGGVINGMYDQASQVNAFGARISILGDLISDNTFISSVNSGRYIVTNTMSWTVANSDGEFGQIRALNGIVALANLAINAEISDFTSQSTVNNLKGEAYIGRGLAYFYMVNFYSSNPTSGQYQEYGVPIYTGPYNPDYKGPRNTVDEVYDQVISDLTTALNLMTNETPANKGHLSPTAARLLLSRVYLTRGKAGDYDLALQYANQVINSAHAGSFDFINSSNYVNYFSSTDTNDTENQDETVWEVNMTAADNPGTNEALGALYPSNGSQKCILFKQDFVDSFSANGASDVRALLFGNQGPADDIPRGVFTKKWPRSTSEGNFTINVKILRMSEAKLNRIEALYRLGQTTTALTELNNFASTRGGNTYTGSDLLNDILTERRKEFFAEGQRFFDLKRNNLPIIKTMNCESNCETPADNRRFVFPMPILEMTQNTLMTQHPLWQ